MPRRIDGVGGASDGGKPEGNPTPQPRLTGDAAPRMCWLAGEWRGQDSNLGRHCRRFYRSPRRLPAGPLLSPDLSQLLAVTCANGPSTAPPSLGVPGRSVLSRAAWRRAERNPGRLGDQISGPIAGQRRGFEAVGSFLPTPPCAAELLDGEPDCWSCRNRLTATRMQGHALTSRWPAVRLGCRSAAE
jgi:hypothetical protein